MEGIPKVVKEHDLRKKSTWGKEVHEYTAVNSNISTVYAKN